MVFSVLTLRCIHKKITLRQISPGCEKDACKNKKGIDDLAGTIVIHIE